MTLEEHPFIQSIAEKSRKSIIEEIKVLEFDNDTVIFKEGSPPDALFLILSGNVTFTKENLDGSLRNVSQAGEGSFFGEISIFTGENRALGATATGHCCIARVPEPTVRKIMEDAAPVRKILESVIHHLKSTTDHYMDEIMSTEKLTLVGTMMSSLLHDFKNPFAIINLGSNIIQQRHKDDPKTAEICNNIESQIRRMVNMANELAAFGRGDSQIEIAPINVDALFDQFQKLNTHFFEDPSVHLSMQGNGASLQGDASKLLRVLQNLITNSIEALHGANLKGKVTVNAAERGNIISFTISDTGPGIPEKIQDTFFDPFVTLGKSEGTGLGTAIVKSIIEAHRGEIRFETSAKGTTFTIWLPKNM